MTFELMASMMCANYGSLEKEVHDLETSGIDSFHIDIMDGRYVPNFAMSINDMRYIAGISKRAVPFKPPERGYGLYPPGSGIPPFYNLAEDHRCGHDPGDRR